MYVLDTDTITAVLRNPTEYLIERINAVPDHIFISVVVAEEMIRGVFKTLHANRHRPQVTRHYEFLRGLVTDLSKFPLLPYSDAAETIFQSFSPAVRRVGLRDCRIAASAMAQQPERFIVITRNLDDFRTIGAHCENWIDRPTNNTI